MLLYPMKIFYESIKEEQYFQIGLLKKTNDINGAMVVSFLYEVDDAELVKLPVLFVEVDHIKVPYCIKNIIYTEHKTMVQLHLIQTKTEAYAFHNFPLFVPASLKPKLIKSTIPYNFLVGFLVNEVTLGSLGKIQMVYCVRDRYIIGIDYQEKELLVPYHVPFIVGINENQRVVTVQLPEGFLDAML